MPQGKEREIDLLYIPDLILRQMGPMQTSIKMTIPDLILRWENGPTYMQTSIKMTFVFLIICKKNYVLATYEFSICFKIIL